MADIREWLYQAIKELEYVRSVENCNSGLCASAVGAEIIEEGMKALGIKFLAEETLSEENAEESK